LRSTGDAAPLADLAAFDAAPGSLLILDRTGIVRFASQDCTETFRAPRESLVRTALEDHLAPECRAGWRTVLAEVLDAPPTADTRKRLEVTGLRDPAEAVPIEVSLRAFGVPAGRMVVVAVRDLTEQRRSEEASKRLEALLEFAPAFVIGVDRAGRIDFINKTRPEYTKEDTIGTSWLQYFPPDQHATMTAVLAAVFEKGTTEIYEVSLAGTPTTAPVWFESHIAPVRIGGQIVAAVMVSQDVSERKRTQAELLAGRHMALLGTLASGIAHEINTPIQFLGDSIRFLSDGNRDLLALLDKVQELRRAAHAGSPLDDIVREAAVAEEEADLPYLRENLPQAFERCIDGLNQVARIVRSLKDYAHPSENEMVPADLNRTVESSLTIAKNEYKYVADLRTELGALPPVRCHANEIGQVVVNIVVNAAHAIGDVVRDSDRKGTISVRTWCEGDDVLIAIADTGGGIPEAVRARIFDPFFTTKEVGKGTGQGLAIAWSTVKERHRGQLTFETEMGEGTTFFIRLPISGK
jgi:PAS domain S-box-containing protein